AGLRLQRIDLGEDVGRQALDAVELVRHARLRCVGRRPVYGRQARLARDRRPAARSNTQNLSEKLAALAQGPRRANARMADPGRRRFGEYRPRSCRLPLTPALSPQAGRGRTVSWLREI